MRKFEKQKPELRCAPVGCVQICSFTDTHKLPAGAQPYYGLQIKTDVREDVRFYLEQVTGIEPA